MHVLLFAVFVLFARAHAAPETRAPCPVRCDMSECPVPRAACRDGRVSSRCACCAVCAPGSEGGTCGRGVTCGSGLECVRSGAKKSSKGVCRCKSRSPVCGSDGKTYGTPCRLEAARRRARHRGDPPVTRVHKDLCASPSPGPTHHSSLRYKFNFIADVVEKIAPAVVHIELFLSHPLFGHHVPLSSGSGFIVTDTGVIVTNAHVVSSSATSVGRQQLQVQLHDGKTYEASITDIDKKSDIATIKVDPRKKLPVLHLGHSADLRPGEFVVAIGSPFALQNTVTTGIVSTAQRDGKELGIRDSDMDYIQTDAIINYGNSGGPLVNLDGEVIGINTLKVTAGISFAIPSDRINRFLDDSHDKRYKDKHKLVRLQYMPSQPVVSDSDVKSTKKRFLGIKMIALTKNLSDEMKQHDPYFPDISSGILVHEVIPDSPAQKGGLEAGDVIVKLNGRSLVSTDDIQSALHEDTPLLLEIYRGSNSLLFNIEPQVLLP
ncbi:serine protease HTRA3-like isoform 2-T2 [Clarias gariepinus]|uniref:serine protease HTRA3-like isoform X2 n=1 Tax=Clarias gariepinus TaxID=13013 RepID=UPI00234C21EB|nr:serine protease HTRA3-like isoform X2 [Clarias gariepinus]